MTLLTVENLVKEFFLVADGKVVHAVNGVSLHLEAGETLGIVGESGCGKSTLANCILRLVEPSYGEIRFGGVDIARAKGRKLRAVRTRMQAVFQDPVDAMNPRMKVKDIIAEPLKVAQIAKSTQEKKVETLLRQVKLDPELKPRFPHQLSGGQQQRVVIARALSTSPELIVLDEPTSAVDFAVRGEIIELLREVQEAEGCAYLFISHDLNTVLRIADRVAVMYLGRIVEEGPASMVLRRPGHPYTVALRKAVPVADPARRERMVLRGDVPSAVDLPQGCAFRLRCKWAQEACKVRPELEHLEDAHRVACHRATEVAEEGG